MVFLQLNDHLTLFVKRRASGLGFLFSRHMTFELFAQWNYFSVYDYLTTARGPTGQVRQHGGPIQEN